MKKYEIRIAARNPMNPMKVESLDIIESDNLFELVAQLTFVLLRIQRNDIEIQRRHDPDDDIPF